MLKKSLKKWVVTAAAALACALPAFAQTFERNRAIFQYNGADRAQRIAEKAKQEGTLLIYTSLPPAELKIISDKFESKYGVKIQVWRATGEQVLQRTVAEARGQRYVVDLVEMNGTEIEGLAREKVLAEFFTPYLAELPPGIVPRHRLWLPDRLNFFMAGYNTQKVKREELPKTYEGFLDPKWKNRIALEAHDFGWMSAIVKEWGEQRGMDFFQKLAATKISMRDNHLLLVQLTAAGDIDVGLTTYYANIVSAKAKGSPIDWAPIEPLVASPLGFGIARNAPHPHAALLFGDFMLSPEGQELLASVGLTPIRQDVVKTEFSGKKFVVIDPAMLLDQPDKWEGTWTKLFMGSK